MRRTGKMAGEPIVTSLDVLDMIINHTVDVYNTDVSDLPEVHKNGYRAGWLGYRVLGTLFATGYIEAGNDEDQLVIDDVLESLTDKEDT